MNPVLKFFGGIFNKSKGEVIASTEAITGVPFKDIKSKSKVRDVVIARRHLIEKLAERTDLEYDEIAKTVNRSTRYVRAVLRD